MSKSIYVDCGDLPQPITALRPAIAQRGDALIEALLAILLAAVIGLGLSYTASRLMHTQRTLNAQNIAHQAVREGLMGKGFAAAQTCATANASADAVTWSASKAYTKSGKPIPLTLTCHLANVRINGVDLSLNIIQSVKIGDKGEDSKDLLGGDGEMEFTVSVSEKT